jgi:hypothetical protein
MPYSATEKQRKYQREWSQKRRKRHKAVTDRLRAVGCAECKEVEICALTFHHLDPDAKSFSMGSGRAGSLPGSTYRTESALEEEAKKCVVLCFNCHAKVHAGKLVLTGQKVGFDVG